jgi:HSP20 family molecular chaperone IbpA
MSRVSNFNSPLLLGFEHLERLLDNVSKGAADGYPPYNIERIGANRLRITLACAGFAAEDLAITVEDGQLVVRGRRKEEDASRVFLHRGIAARQFQRAYVLAEGIEVTGATLDNGMLNIDLERPMPEPRVRTIPISKRSAPPGGAPATLIVSTCRNTTER